MPTPQENTAIPDAYQNEKRKQKREWLIVLGIIIVVILLTLAENRLIHTDGDSPVSNTILMFSLLNISLLLLMLLIFLVFRNLAKLLYDRKRKIIGTKLRTKLVVTFITLTLLPSSILFFFSIGFITNSIRYWFKVPVEQALNNSLKVGRWIYDHEEAKAGLILEQMAQQIKTGHYFEPSERKALSDYVKITREEFHLQAVEVYDTHSNRITLDLSEELAGKPLGLISSDYFQTVAQKKKVKTFSEMIPEGELVRTLGTVPYDAKDNEAEGFLAVSVVIPSSLSENIASISRGYEEYQQIKLLKKPVQSSYYIALSIVALLVLFCAIWFGFTLAKSISIPIMELSAATEKIAEGDLSFRIDPSSDDEIGILVDSFNKMTRDLRISREQVELSTRMLRKQNLEIEARRKYIEIVLKKVSAGVITVEADETVSTINVSAGKMLGLNPDEVLNQKLTPSEEENDLQFIHQILEQFERSGKDDVELPLKLTVKAIPRSFWVHVNALKDETGNQVGTLMVFNDLTDLEKAQRMLAWREVARRIAHEVKNPLTPISLSAQRLKRKYSRQIHDPVFDECTDMIINHVELIRNLVNEFAAFARFPTADPKPCDLLPIIRETVALYRESRENIHFHMDILDEIPLLNLDRQQIKQALINLMDNALAAIRGKGNIFISAAHDPILKMVRLEISDDGMGISPKEKTRLFEPDFSTKKTGMGLGLSIVNNIILDHNGRISVMDNQPHGATFVIELPV
ncbi:MAG: HAMP domain-containing protein [Proteobacteria bacterium]|nr:HAMP domain-containing protein [Pseudomonadota bacterium]MBU4469394.1 HAMP domain-containing protein [Pseudomonadota bacterium]MCG2751847.1 ATP-binding protein [Desulfobacteraceae bacterium]